VLLSISFSVSFFFFLNVKICFLENVLVQKCGEVHDCYLHERMEQDSGFQILFIFLFTLYRYRCFSNSLNLPFEITCRKREITEN